MSEWIEIEGASGLRSYERIVRGGWSLLTLALPLHDGTSLVVSPTSELGDDAHASLAKIGAPRGFLAPNHFHHLGLPEWTQRHPEAIVVASDASRKRLAKKQPNVAFEPLARVPLPKGVTFLEPEGMKTGETWLRIETSAGVTWVVSDAFFDVSRPVSGLSGFGLRATGTIPGLRIGSTFLWLALEDKKRYGAWLLDRLNVDRPKTLVVGHGEPVSGDDLGDRLRALVQQRVLA